METMDKVHCYLLHAERCGVVVGEEGRWWRFEDGGGSVACMVYGSGDQARLDEAWRHGRGEVMVGRGSSPGPPPYPRQK